MKKIIAVLFSMTLMILIPQFVSASEHITVIVNEKKLNLSVEPIIVNDRTMVPLRPICEALGCTIDWDAETETATISHPVSVVNMTIGSYWFKKNSLLDNTKNVEKQMEAPPIIYMNSTMIPIRALAEAINAIVEWDEGTQTVRITLYDYDAYYMVDGWAKVRKGRKYGLVNKAGKMIVPVEYDDLDYRRDGFIGIQKGKKWGFVDEKLAKVIVEPIYDSIWYFDSGFASVEKDGKWGFIDKTGKVVIPLSYEAIWHYEKGYAICKKDGKWGAIEIKTKATVAYFTYSTAETIYLAALPDYTPYLTIGKQIDAPNIIKIPRPDTV